MLRCVRLLALCLLAGWMANAASLPERERLEVLGRLVRDESPKVRVEALRALAKIPSSEAATLALGALELPMDPTLDYALWLTINDLAEPWIAAVQSGVWKPDGREKQLAFALKALKPEQVSRVLHSVLADRPLPRDGSGPWIEVIGAAGSPADLRRLLDQARTGGFDETTTVKALRALGDAARLRKQRPPGDLASVAEFLKNPSEPVRLEAIRLAGQWKEIGSALPVLLNEVAARGDLSLDERTAVFEALRQIGGEEVTRGLRTMSAADREPAGRRAAAMALASLDASAGFPAVVEAAGTLGTEENALQYWRGVLGIKGSSAPLREALIDRKLSEIVARAGMRVAREGGRDDLELVTAFAQAGGLSASTEQLTASMLQELAARALAQGDPHRGEQVYRRPELACTTCHAIGGAGGKVGPDMTSLGASAPMDYLVEALLLPNAKIKEGYHAVVVETKDGEEVSGTVARETPDELFLRTAGGQEVAVAKRNVGRREIGKLSLMPSNVLEPLSEAERLDLLAFLGRLGKPGDFDASRGGVARRWRIANVVHTDLQNNEGDWFWTKALEDRRWSAVYSLVSGDLPRALIDEAVKAQAWTSKVAVVFATEVDQVAAGTVRFRLQAPDAELWVAGRRLGSGPEITGEVPAGRQRIIVKCDPRRLPESLRLEADGTAFVLN